MIRLFTEFFLLLELENLSHKDDFRFVSPRTVLSLLRRLETSVYYRKQIGKGGFSSLDSLLNAVWERAARQAAANPPTLFRWVKVMGKCNELLCLLIPEGTRDPHLTYMGDIQQA